MRFLNRIGLLFLLGLTPVAGLQAGNGCGCSTGDYSVTCCNPAEVRSRSCTMYLYTDYGHMYFEISVSSDLDLC